MIDYLLEHLSRHSQLAQLEDYVPAAVVLEIFLGRRIQFEQILEASKKHGTIHMILLDLKLDLPAEVNERIKKN